MLTHEAVHDKCEEIWNLLLQYDKKYEDGDFDKCEALEKQIRKMLVVLLTQFTDYLASPKVIKKDLYVIN